MHDLAASTSIVRSWSQQSIFNQQLQSCNMLRSGMICLLLAMMASQAQAHCTYAGLPAANLTQLCSVKPTSDAAACTILNLCRNATLSPPMSQSVCNVSVLATEFCLDDKATVGGVDYCTAYITHINSTESAEGNSIESCWAELGVAQNYSIPTTNTVRQAAFNNCLAMGGAGSMPGCDTCTNATAAGCPNPLLKLAQGCVDMNMPACETGGWRSFCAKEAAANGQTGAGAPALCLSATQQAALASQQVSTSATNSTNSTNSAKSTQMQWGLMAALIGLLSLVL